MEMHAEHLLAEKKTRKYGTMHLEKRIQFKQPNETWINLYSYSALYPGLKEMEITLVLYASLIYLHV